MKFIFTLIFLALLTLHPPLHAEGRCPPGYYPWDTPGVSSCIPIPGYNQQQQQPNPPRPLGHWESRWGAIATDDTLGVLGVSSDVSTRASAEKKAINDCQTKGGKQCALNISYDNTCAAMIVGDEGYSVRTGGTKEEAISYATKDCSASYHSCHTYYFNCSKPVLVQ